MATKLNNETLEGIYSCDNLNSNLNCVYCKNYEIQIYKSCVNLLDSSNTLEVI